MKIIKRIMKNMQKLYYNDKVKIVKDFYNGHSGKVVGKKWWKYLVEFDSGEVKQIRRSCLEKVKNKNFDLSYMAYSDEVELNKPAKSDGLFFNSKGTKMYQFKKGSDKFDVYKIPNWGSNKNEYNKFKIKKAQKEKKVKNERD
jgi:hypothetical protein